MPGRIIKPAIVQGEVIRPLRRESYGSNRYDEAWLQDLIFKQPGLLPCAALDPALADMRSLARELPTDHGPIDVVLVNEHGRVALVECKLWRNSQARREAVAQVMDYATAMSKWGTTHFEKQFKAADQRGADSFAGLFEDQGRSFDEQRFLDGLADTLSKGRFLLLVVGDGIRREAQELAETVASAPHLGFHLALVEIGLYREEDDTDDGPLVVIPEVVTRTREVTRAVVEVRVETGPVDVKVSVADAEPNGRGPISEAEFFDRLAASSGSDHSRVAAFVRNVLSATSESNLRVQWMEAGPVLKFDEDRTGRFFNFGQLSRSSELTNVSRLRDRIDELGLPVGIYTDYLDSMIEFLPDAHRETVRSKSGKWVREEIIVAGVPGLATGNVPLRAIEGHEDDWLATIDTTISRIRAAIEDRPRPLGKVRSRDAPGDSGLPQWSSQ